MPRVVYLDSGPLGLACNPRSARGHEAANFRVWLNKTRAQRTRIVVPAIADYEVRRELVRINSPASIAELDRIESGQHPDFPGVIHLPLADAALKRAARLWAEARTGGCATAGQGALDGDVIVAPQVLEDAGPSGRFLIATGNVGDIVRYVGMKRAKAWPDIVA